MIFNKLKYTTYLILISGPNIFKKACDNFKKARKLEPLNLFIGQIPNPLFFPTFS